MTIFHRLTEMFTATNTSFFRDDDVANLLIAALYRTVESGKHNTLRDKTALKISKLYTYFKKIEPHTDDEVKREKNLKQCFALRKYIF